MNVTELSQVVADPDTPASLMLELMKLVPERKMGLWTRIKVDVGYRLHRFGVHTWVRWQQYDKQSKRIIDTGGRVCAYCSQGRLK